jgi:hypothetical protein
MYNNLEYKIIIYENKLKIPYNIIITITYNIKIYNTQK